MSDVKKVNKDPKTTKDSEPKKVDPTPTKNAAQKPAETKPEKPKPSAKPQEDEGSWFFTILVILLAFSAIGGYVYVFHFMPEEKVYVRPEINVERSVIVLTDANFDLVIAENDYLLVEVYAPWCGHCKNLAPKYAAAAETLEHHESPVKLAKLDGTRNVIQGQWGVNAYPTLFFFVKGVRQDYDGGREEHEIVHWCQNKVKPTTHEVTTQEELDDTIAANKMFVLFWGDFETEGWDAYDLTSKAFAGIHFAFTNNPELKKQFEVQDDVFITLFKDFDDKVAHYNGELEFHEIFDFLYNAKFPVVMTLDKEVDKKMRTSGKSSLVLIYQDDYIGNYVKDNFVKASVTLKDKFLIVMASYDDDYGKRFADEIGVDRGHLPAVRIIKPPFDKPKRYMIDEWVEPTAENIIKFGHQFIAGKLAHYPKSARAPHEQTGPVKVVVGDTWIRDVLNNDWDVFVYFYTPSCQFCKTFDKEYEKLAQTFKNVGQLVLAKIDYSANEVDGLEITSFPSFKLYRGKNKSPIDFVEGNTIGLMQNWIRMRSDSAIWGNF